EKGQIVLRSSSVTVDSTYFCPQEGHIPIVCENHNSIRGALTLRNVEFARMYGMAVHTGYDVQLDTHWSLAVDNCHRRHLAVNNVQNGTHTGILLWKADGSRIDEFGRSSHSYAVRGNVGQRYLVSAPAYSETRGAPVSGIISAHGVTVPGVPGLTGQRYYNMQVLLDRARLIGRGTTQGEKSFNPIGQLVGLSLDLESAQNSIVRLYRGTSPGSYDAVVDIPMLGAGVLWDAGDNVNGYPWVPRTAGGMDTINGLGEQSVIVNSGLVEVRAAAYPTVGSWAAGDTVMRAAPTAGGKRGWVCVAGGNPGTWKPWGSIDS